MMIIKNVTKEPEDIIEEATIPRVSYFTFRIELPQVPITPELSDLEVLHFAQLNGQFNFLNEPEEDIYNLSDGSPL